MAAKIALIAALILCSCGKNAPTDQHKPSNTLDEIRYVSGNSKFGMVFSGNAFRAGFSIMLKPGRSPNVSLKMIANLPDVQCVSVGPPGNSEEFAIKRPIALGDRYKCLGTTFKVDQCFEGCASAVIDREVPATGGRSGTIGSYMLVDRCSGMLALSQSKKMTDGIPLDAVLLRGPTGILADNNSSGCR